MSLIGQFHDLDNPDRFVWLRGFPDMSERARSLSSFYDGPVWHSNRDTANSTMLDSSDCCSCGRLVATPHSGSPATGRRWASMPMRTEALSRPRSCTSTGPGICQPLLSSNARLHLPSSSWGSRFSPTLSVKPARTTFRGHRYAKASMSSSGSRAFPTVLRMSPNHAVTRLSTRRQSPQASADRRRCCDSLLPRARC